MSRPTADYTSTVKKDNSSDAQTAATLWDPAAGNRVVVVAIIISSLTAQTTKFLFDSTEVTPIIYTGANGNIVMHAGGRPLLVGAADEILKYTTTAAVATSVMVIGYEDAV